MLTDTWTRPARCGSNACVEARLADPDTVAVRDSKTPHAPALRFTRDEWAAFVAAVRDGEYDLP